MKEPLYAALWANYDKLNSETDYEKWADFICTLFQRHAVIPVTSVLDLACGTGSMTFALHRRGYDMTALDLSPEMLCCAREKADACGAADILWLCQDMRAFELYGTVSAVVCCLDGINHLTGAGDLERCFSLVHNYLEPGGLFVFDVNTPKKFQEFYGNNDYILEDDGVLCCWQNQYDARRQICTFSLSVFEENEDGTWTRTDTVQRERCYSREKLVGAVEGAGFSVQGIYTGGAMEAETETAAHRWYIAARRD